MRKIVETHLSLFDLSREACEGFKKSGKEKRTLKPSCELFCHVENV